VTRRTALLFAAAAALGLGAAAAVIATRDDARPAPAHASTAKASTAKTSPAKATPVDNRFRLSRAESQRLLDWAVRFRSCMARRGVALGAPVAHPKEIDIAIVRAPAPKAFETRLIACGDGLGEPPRRSSLQSRPGKLVLYLPKQCLLDKTVVSPTKAS
jgi:hypothetical protein